MTDSTLPGAFDTAGPGVPPGPLPQVPGYEVVRELGRGGVGVVYLARQHSLNRQVALKLLRAGSTADVNERRRIRAEAEAIARLRHPNVVQIHEIGEADGQPYLALEYVEGGSLADRIAGTPMQPAAAAELVETIARAMHAAHLQHVVHRDLKPGNILLSDGQRTEDRDENKAESPATFAARRPSPVTPKVSDFGLVKRTDETLPATSTGVVVGTPSYMAPEQASGGAVGPAADVYALGAILYELLTGRPPFRGPTPLDTVMQVLADDPVPPRELQPRLPRDLETVCLLCLRKTPARRYPSALALADDLRRFLDGRPVWARRTGAAERAVKWARRRPARAVGLALGVVLVGVLAVDNHRLGRKQQEVEAAYLQSRTQEQAARDTVAAFFTVVSENRLLREPGMEGLRRDLLGRAADFYRGLVEHQRDAPAVRAELARAYLRLAALTGDLGDPAGGLVLAARAEGEFRALLAANPDDGAVATDLAAVAERQGDLHRAAGDAAAAEAAYRAAAGGWERLIGVLPEDDRTDRLATVHERLAQLARSAGRGADAEAAVAAARSLRESHSAIPVDRPRLAALHALDAELHRDRGDAAAAEQLLRGALKLWGEATDGTATPDERDEHAAAWHRLGVLCLDADRPGEAAEALGAAVRLRRLLVRDHSAVPGFRHRLAVTLCDLARVHLGQDRGYAAEPLADEARELLTPLAETHPAVVDFRADLARCLDLLVPWYGVTGRSAAADRNAAAAAAAWTELCDRHPDRADFRLARADGRRLFGEACHAAGRAVPARAAFRESVRLFDELGTAAAVFGAARAEQGLGESLWATDDPAAGATLRGAHGRLEALVAAHPRVSRYRAALAGALDLTAQRQAGGGVAAATDVLRHRERLAREFPAVVVYAHEFARAHTRLGNRLADAGRGEDALRAQREGVRLRRELVRTMPEAERRFQSDAAVRHETAEALLDMVFPCLTMGRPDEAAAAAREALAEGQRLAADYANVPRYQDTLAECHYRAGEVDRRSGRLAEAEAAFHRALVVRGPLAGAHPTNRLFGVNLAGDLVGLARVAFRRGRWDSAADWASQAVARLGPLQQAAPGPVAADLLRQAVRVRGAAMARAGRASDALADWRRLEAGGGWDGRCAGWQRRLAGCGLHDAAALAATASELASD